MIGLFVALFGGVYYASKMIDERQYRAKKQEKDEQERRRLSWVISGAYNQRAMVHHKFVSDPYGCLKEIERELNYIFDTDNYMQYFENYPFAPGKEFSEVSTFYTVWQLAYAAYAAKNGFCSQMRYRTDGIPTIVNYIDGDDEHLAGAARMRTLNVIAFQMRGFFGPGEEGSLWRHYGDFNEFVIYACRDSSHRWWTFDPWDYRYEREEAARRKAAVTAGNNPAAAPAPGGSPCQNR